MTRPDLRPDQLYLPRGGQLVPVWSSTPDWERYEWRHWTAPAGAVAVTRSGEVWRCLMRGGAHWDRIDTVAGQLRDQARTPPWPPAAEVSACAS